MLYLTYFLSNAMLSVETPLNFTNVQAVVGVQTGQLIPENPVIDSLSLNSVYVSGNQPILIQGSGLLSTISVTFGGRAAQWFYANPFQIVCQPPPTLSAGLVLLTITTASGPGGTTTPATTNFTYTKATITGTLTNLFRQVSPFSSQGAFFPQALTLGLEGDMWVSVPSISGTEPGFTTATPTIVLTFNTNGSPTLKVIANGNSTSITISNLFQYPSNLTHTIKQFCVAGDGRPWTFDHHGNITAVNKVNAGTDPYSADIYPLHRSGDTTLVGISVVCWKGYIVITGSSADTIDGYLWKINPFNPLDQVCRKYTGLALSAICVGKNGNLYVGFLARADMMELDESLNPIGSIIATPNGKINGMCLGNDGNLWIVAYNPVSPFNSSVVRIMSDDYTNQTATNLSTCGIALGICSGTDGNIWVAGDNETGVPIGTGTTPSDSVVYKISSADVSILNTYTLTGSVGGTPITAAGGCQSIASDGNGGICVSVKQIRTASPITSGYIVRIT